MLEYVFGRRGPDLSGGDARPRRAIPTTPTAPLMRSQQDFHVAESLDRQLVVRDAAAARAGELVTLRTDRAVSGRIVCLVVQQARDSVEVELPTGPAGRTEWVDRNDVALSRQRFRIEVAHGAGPSPCSRGRSWPCPRPWRWGRTGPLRASAGSSPSSCGRPIRPGSAAPTPAACQERATTSPPTRPDRGWSRSTGWSTGPCSARTRPRGRSEWRPT